MVVGYIDFVVYYNFVFFRSCSYVNVHFVIYRTVVMIVKHFAG